MVAEDQDLVVAIVFCSYGERLYSSRLGIHVNDHSALDFASENVCG
mgnify:CR=1 FL=1